MQKAENKSLMPQLPSRRGRASVRLMSRMGDIRKPEYQSTREATLAAMGNVEQRSKDAVLPERVDDDWGLAEDGDDPNKSFATGSASEQKESLEPGAATQRSALDDADTAQACAITEKDDRTVAAFRAKTEALQNKLAMASSQSQASHRKPLLAGLAGGLVVGICIGWFASQATIGPHPDTDNAAVALASQVLAAEIKPRAEPREVAANDIAALPEATVDSAHLLAGAIGAAPSQEQADAVRGESPGGASAEDSKYAVTSVTSSVQTGQGNDAPSKAAASLGRVITSPREGAITKIFAKPGQRVWTGERLFEVSRQTSAAETAAGQEEKIAKLEALQERDEAQNAELAKARRKVDLFRAGFRGDSMSVAYALKGGYVEHQLEEGAVVKLGEVLGHVRALDK